LVTYWVSDSYFQAEITCTRTEEPQDASQVRTLDEFKKKTLVAQQGAEGEGEKQQHKGEEDIVGLLEGREIQRHQQHEGGSKLEEENRRPVFNNYEMFSIRPAIISCVKRASRDSASPTLCSVSCLQFERWMRFAGLYAINVVLDIQNIYLPILVSLFGGFFTC
jgi:hypothetical protein